ncbi:MAG: hypothetical protein ABSE72_05555 [Bacteroidales bacterium]
MKRIILLLSAGLLISLLSFSQKITPDKIPALVKQAFTKMFPSATGMKYLMEKKNYEVNFTDPLPGIFPGIKLPKWAKWKNQVLGSFMKWI